MTCENLIDSTVHRRSLNQGTIGISRHHLAVDTEPYRENIHRLVIQIHFAAGDDAPRSERLTSLALAPDEQRSGRLNWNGRRRVARLCVVVVAIAGCLVVSPSHPVQAFTPDNHEAATSVLRAFLRSGVYDEIEAGHEWADSDPWPVSNPRLDEPSIHADDCAFGETATQINSFHARAVATLTPGDYLDPWAASDEFGRSLHPIQDFYSHSNWVELGFPVAQRARASDLVDFSTRLAGTNRLGPWAAPGPLGLVRGNILSADFVTPRRFRFQSAKGFLEPLDWNGDGKTDAADATVADFPAGWRVGLLPHPNQPGKAGFVPGIDTNGNGQFTSLPTFGPGKVPVLQSGADRRLLISGVGARPATSVFKNQCDPYERDAAGNRAWPLTINSCTSPGWPLPDHYSCIAYHGSRFALTHSGSADSELRKDDEDDGPTRFPKALALAKLQTAYEWCRLVNRAGQTRNGADGVLLTLWVKEGRSPHPQNTPCAPADMRGRVGVRVTVDRVRIREDQDKAADEPGEINLSLALYDPPSRFHQSVKSAVGPVFVNDDGGADSILVGAEVPGSVRLCPGPTGRFRVALHGWDDDEGSDNGLEVAANGDYNRDNSTPDDVLTGFTAEHSLTDVPLTGSATVTKVSKDMVVTYRLRRTAGC